MPTNTTDCGYAMIVRYRMLKSIVIYTLTRKKIPSITSKQSHSHQYYNRLLNREMWIYIRSHLLGPVSVLKVDTCMLLSLSVSLHVLYNSRSQIIIFICHIQHLYVKPVQHKDYLFFYDFWAIPQLHLNRSYQQALGTESSWT